MALYVTQAGKSGQRSAGLALRNQQTHLEEDVRSLHSIAEGDGFSEYGDVDGHFVVWYAL
jgi:hypothetical protein